MPLRMVLTPNPQSSIKGAQAQTIRASPVRATWRLSAQGESCPGTPPSECVLEVGRPLGTDRPIPRQPSCTVRTPAHPGSLQRKTNVRSRPACPVGAEGGLRCTNGVTAGWPCRWLHAAPPGDSQDPVGHLAVTREAVWTDGVRRASSAYFCSRVLRGCWPGKAYLLEEGPDVPA